MRWTRAFVAVVVAAAPVLLHAQGPGSPLGVPSPSRLDDPPTFRSAVTIIQIDVRVTDAAGQPVTGLTAADFEVREAGQRRRLVSVAEVAIPIEPSVGLPPEDAAEPDVATNTGPQGRTYVFALDEVGLDRALRTRYLLRQFLDQHFGLHDRAAVVLTGRGLADSGQDFTGNRRLLLEAVDKFSGGFSGDGQSDRCPKGSNARQLASSLRALTEFLATIPGRKTLVYVGEGLGGLDFWELQSYRGGVLSLAATDALAALAAATRGNVTIYPVDPCGLVGGTAGPGSGAPPRSIQSIETRIYGGLENRMDLRALADVTGGFATTNTNNFAPAFERLVQESSVYYTLGFESGSTRRDGRFVPVDVRVTTRPDVEVRARAGYMAPLGTERRPDPVRGEGRFATVRDALASAVPTPAVPLQVVAAPYRDGRDSAVALAVEIGVAALDLTVKNGVRTGPIEVSYLATDSRGKVQPGRRHAATVTLAEDRAGTGEQVRLMSAVRLKPGRYQLRIAAGTAARAGSVLYDLEVPDFGKDALTMSGLFLSADRAGDVAATLAPVAPLGGALPGPPTARRTFARDETPGLFVEVYENGVAQAPAHTIALTATLRDAEGRVLPLATEHRPAPVTRNPSAAYRFSLSLPLADVPSGAYALEVEARSDHRDGAAVTRRIPIRVQ